MASSSSRSRDYSYNVFASFHGADVRKTLLSHIREQFNRNGITMFDDQEIERSATIAPSLTKAIKESRISIVILSKRYASSGWCLDELVEILECKRGMGQIVMTIFYGVEPSHVRKQIGDFGIAFNQTCARKKPTDEQKQKWINALNDVGNIEGEDFLRWDNEAKMIKKIAKDVLDKLNATASKDFDGMEGLDRHLTRMESLLDLDDDGVKMVAISGPAGIGKTTIARALHSLIRDRFQLTCFVDNRKGSYPPGLDDYGLKLRLQEQLLSNILNQNCMTISHLGVVKERLCDKRVLIILDDVDNIRQLEALANEPTWFGSGSRIVVTTENNELLQQHGINNTYHVGFPSDVEAIDILRKYAFRKRYPHDDFEVIAERITELCGKLPLGLRVVGSSLRGKKVEEWEEVMQRLETVLDRDIEDVLRVGYEILDENDQSLFLHIAVFFNYKDGDLVKAISADGDRLEVKRGLKILANRSLIDLSANGKRIVMHKLLQQMARQVIRKQVPSKRQVLVDADEICGVLENGTGTGVVSGISFDISRIDEVSIDKRAFKKMPNLRYLRVYKSRADGNDRLYIPDKMELPRRLRLLHWEAYPNKCLPPTFHPGYLVELDMTCSQLEYLWQGAQLLANLKKMDLSGSSHLKELPDLSNATNLERLNLRGCMRLVEIPSSFSHLHKLKKLKMGGCINLEVIPAHMNLASLDSVNMQGCSKLRKFPDMSTNIRKLDISKTAVEDVPASIAMWSRLETLSMWNNRKLKGITHLPLNVLWVNASYSGIEKIPDCMKALHQLQELDLSGCRRLASLPELPGSLNNLRADDCESLESVFFQMKQTPDAMLSFINNFKLSQQARREIIIGSLLFRGSALLPGREVPAEFHHRARGNSLTIPHSAFSTFKVCLVISPNPRKNREYMTSQLLCCRIFGKDDLYPTDREFYIGEDVSKYRAEHLFIFHSHLLDEYINPAKGRTEITFEFSSPSSVFNITECAAKICTQQTIQGSYESGSEHLHTKKIISKL
ncbi:hypothetical protein Bca4012_027910 [Brassica carinata]|uniref:ADP-ribosyl cyclase/cyclic ADP-ribose hydrolase n=1 Tax=Brassica carinata TaxID=52824 RepID=A0A8X8AX89_BRACI|nr:hypothetical protein Bca52824_024904 [Brassica carinata]